MVAFSRPRSSRRTVTVSPASLAIALRTSALIGSLWVPSPRAMNELRNGWPSTVPRTLTRPWVPKYSAEPGITTYVQPPLLGLFSNVAVNCLVAACSSELLCRRCNTRWTAAGRPNSSLRVGCVRPLGGRGVRRHPLIVAASRPPGGRIGGSEARSAAGLADSPGAADHPDPHADGRRRGAGRPAAVDARRVPPGLGPRGRRPHRRPRRARRRRVPTAPR